MLFGKNRRLSRCALCVGRKQLNTHNYNTHARVVYIYIHSHAMETNENAKKTHRDDEEDSKEDFREKVGVYASSSAAQQQQQQQQNQERTFTHVFDLADKYAQTRIAHEEKTREAMMSIARARYSLGAVGWEAVANDVEAKKTSAKCCVAKVTSSSSDDDDDDDERNAFRAVFITDDDEEEEKEGEEEDEQTTKGSSKSFGRRRRQKPVYQARAVIEKFRELTKASAEVLSLKSALGREVERYERQYLTAEAAAATAR